MTNLPKYYALIEEIIWKHLDKHHYALFLFGSRVIGNNAPRSDIDVGLLGENKVPSNKLSLIWEELEECNVPYKIDVVDFYSASEEFCNIALRNIKLWNFPPEFKVKIQTFAKALMGFKELLNEDIQLLNDIQKDGVNNGRIQKFEYCAELCWKLIKCFVWFSDEIEVASPKSSLKAFFQTGYINENQFDTLVKMLEDRNKLSHIYKEEIYQEILPNLSTHCESMELIINIIENKTLENNPN